MYYERIAPAPTADRIRTSAWPRTFATSPVALVLLAAVLIVAINPLGYRGGGADDWHYLSAARCAAENGFCLPADHWARRFPLVLPSGAALALFGETKLGLWIVPLLYGLGAITLFVLMVQRQFGRFEALLAGLVLIGTPIVTERLLETNVDTVEFALALGSVFLVQCSHRRDGARGWLVAAGAMLALAVLARPTSLPLLPIVAVGLWLVPALRRNALAFALGFVIPIAAELIVYGLWTGDPLLPWRLSLGHTRIPTLELAASVDLTQSPLFNIAYIDGWVPSVGIKAHWTVKGLINLLVHPAIGLTLTCAIVFAALGRARLGTPTGGSKLLLFLIAGAALLFGALVYGLAIDPKPRMFFPLAAVASVVFGVFAARSWREGSRLLAGVCLALILGKAAIASYNRPDPQGAGVIAKAWLAQLPAGSVAVESLTAKFLTLTPEVRALPVYPAAGADQVLLLGATDCAIWGPHTGFDGWTIRRSHRSERSEPGFVQFLREHSLFMNKRFEPTLCLLERPA